MCIKQLIYFALNIECSVTRLQLGHPYVLGGGGGGFFSDHWFIPSPSKGPGEDYDPLYLLNGPRID